MFCLAASAQIQFGYMSYKQILQQLPEYAQATKDLAILKAKYEAEAQKGEEEFQRKFVDFLQGQKDFPQAIMQKRQAELQTLMDNGVAFRMKSQELIASAEKDLMQEAYKRLNRALLEVGVEYGYGYILNTDDNNCPYINPVIGFDVTELVRQKLGLTVVPEAQKSAPVAPLEEQIIVPQE
jgi:outer membrane protein